MGWLRSLQSMRQRPSGQGCRCSCSNSWTSAAMAGCAACRCMFPDLQWLHGMVCWWWPASAVGEAGVHAGLTWRTQNPASTHTETKSPQGSNAQQTYRLKRKTHYNSQKQQQTCILRRQGRHGRRANLLRGAGKRLYLMIENETIMQNTWVDTDLVALYADCGAGGPSRCVESIHKRGYSQTAGELDRVFRKVGAMQAAPAPAARAAQAQV